MKIRTVAITGSTGNIGTEIVEMLVKKNYQIKILIRDGSKNKWINSKSVLAEIGDVTSEEDLKKLLEGTDAVIHLAVNLDLNQPYDYFYKVNVESCRNILDICQKFNIKPVMVSTVMVFKDTGNKKIRDERWTIKRMEKYNYYVKSKIEALNIIKKHSYKSVVVYPSIVLSENKLIGGNIDRVNKWVKWIWKNLGGGIPGGLMGIIGRADRMTNVVEVKDVASGIVKALVRGKVGEDYILAGENLTAKDYLLRIGKRVGVKPLKVRMPEVFFKIVRIIPDFVPIPSFVKQIAYGLPQNLYFTSSKAKRDLGYKNNWKI